MFIEAYEIDNLIDELINDISLACSLEKIVQKISSKLNITIIALDKNHELIVESANFRADIKDIFKHLIIQNNTKETVCCSVKGIGQAFIIPIHKRESYIGTLCTYSDKYLLSNNDISALQPVLRIVVTLIRRMSLDSQKTMSKAEGFLLSLIEESEDGLLESIKYPSGVCFPRKMKIMMFVSGSANAPDVDKVLTECFNLSRENYFCTAGGTLCVVSDAREVVLCDPDAHSRFLVFLRTQDLTVYISHTFWCITDIKKYYNQVLVARELNQSAERKHQIIKYSECLVDYIIKVFVESGNSLDMLQHPAYLALIDYDRQNKTAYREFLDTYIALNGNMSACAKTLNIHYNTVKYRYNIIKELTGADLRDENIFALLHISHKVYKYLELHTHR